MISSNAGSSVPRNSRVETSGRTGKRSIVEKDANENANKKKESQFTTCLYIPENKLYLIPFYDYYLIRNFAKSRNEFI